MYETVQADARFQASSIFYFPDATSVCPEFLEHLLQGNLS